MEQKEKEKMPEEIAIDIQEYFWMRYGKSIPKGMLPHWLRDKIKEAIQSERTLREKVEGERDKLLKSMGVHELMAEKGDEITKLKSELNSIRMWNLAAFGTTHPEHQHDYKPSWTELQEENLSLSLQVGKLREALKLADEYPKPTLSFQTMTAVYKTPATSLREAADYEDAKEAAWKKINEILSESPSPKDIGKVVREVAETFEMISKCPGTCEICTRAAEEARTKLREIL